MQNYELLTVIPIKFDDKEIGSIKARVLSLIKKHGGAIINEGDLGRRKLAYSIKKEVYGYYFLVSFSLEAGKLNDIDKDLKSTSEILRYLIVKMRIKGKAELDREERIQKRKIAEEEKKIKEEMVVEEEKAKAPKREKKITLEELDKKLDEILKEDVLEK
jgi:small subunit ribosomal protein S6